MSSPDAGTVAGAGLPESYQVVWDSPSRDSLDSMPLSGRFGAGANVWVQDGSIWLYLAHSGAYDEQGRLLKLGCVRLTPIGLNLGSAGFRQQLDPGAGTISLTQGDYKATLWFAGETMIFESTSSKTGALEVAFGTWRDKQRDGIRCDMMGAKGSFSPDHIQASTQGFLWFHRNAEFSVDLVGRAKAQGITSGALFDATTHRVFGGALAVEGGLSQPAEEQVQWQFWRGKPGLGGPWRRESTLSPSAWVLHWGRSLPSGTRRQKRC